MNKLLMLGLSVAALAVGCGDAPGGDPDAGSARDAGATDAGQGVDASAAGDAGAGDAGTSDASTPDASASDSGPPVDAGPDCEYVAVDEVIVRCDGDFTFVSHFTSTVAGCDPSFYGFDPRDTHFASSAEAIASDPNCDAGCEWHFATSVSRIYCGHRDGYEVLRADGDGCPDVYRFAEGWYESVEAHDAAHPCP